MAFITDDDLTVQLRNEIKQVLTQGNGFTFDTALLFAESEMTSYLRKISGTSVGLIFSATGSERIPVIIMYMIDMAVYHLHSNITPRQIPQIRADRYDAAIKWLEMVAAGRLLPGLPEPPTTETPGSMRVGSNTQYSQEW